MRYIVISILLLAGCSDMTVTQKAALDVAIQIGGAMLKDYIVNDGGRKGS